MKHTILLAILSFVFAADSFLSAQTSRLYGTMQGLPDSRIDYICFDKDNFLWIASENGLTRFDGQAFTTYSSEQDNPYALHSNQISTMYESEDGLHWIGAADGLYFLCRTENKFSHYVMNEQKPNISVSKIVAHPFIPNALLLGTSGFGIFVFDTETRTIDSIKSDQLSFCLKRWNCKNMLTDGNRHLWVTHPQGFICIDMQSFNRIDLKCSNPSATESYVVQDMIEDRKNGLIYMATLENGLVVCDTKTMEVRETSYPELKGHNLTALCLSNTGDLIIGTENQGLFCLQDGKISEITDNNCPVDLRHIKTHSIAFDKQDNLWLGLYQKGVLIIPKQSAIFRSTPIHEDGGIHNLGNVSAFTSMGDGSRLYGVDGSGMLHQRNDGTMQHFNTSTSALESDAVLSICTVSNTTAYVGTYNAGAYLYDGKNLLRDQHLKELDHISIMQIVFDGKRNTLYLGTNGEGVYQYELSTHKLTKISDEYGMLWTTSLHIDSKDRLWLCMSGGMHFIDLSTGKRTDINANHPLKANGYAEDVNGNMWIATNKGLFYFREGSNAFIEASDKDDKFLNGNYSSLEKSSDGHLWISSNTEIISYDPKTKNAVHYSDPVIAETGSYGNRASIVWPDGTIAFGGDNGMLYFSPQDAYAYHRPLQPIYFTRLWVDNEPTDYDPAKSAADNKLNESLWKATKLHLPADNNSFMISFAVQEYCNPVGIRYQYMLEGHDNNWHVLQDNRQSVSYSSLHWGTYNLIVKAILDEGNGNIQTVERSLLISIDAPLWARWWALLIYSALGITTIMLIARFLRNRQHQQLVLERTQQNRRIKDAKLKMFASVSHEIMTPLTMIISPLRKLTQRNNDNATQSVYEMMYRNALRIFMLVNQQMDIRKLDHGQLKLHVKELHLRGFLSEIMQYFDANALGRQINFKLNIPEEHEGLCIWADPQQIDKVFFNLLSNAFKFANDNGEITISISTNETSKTCIIEIFNSGSKLPGDDLNETIKKYTGTDGATEIGLNLSIELTELHHGILTATNTERGVKFFVTLPLGNDHFTAEELAPTEEVPANTDKNKLEKEAKTMQEDHSQKETSSIDANKGLVDLLNDELQEKRRLRERRSSLGFDYNQKQMSSADEKLLARVVECIHKNLGDSDFSVDMMSQQIGISRVHLNRRLKELLDTSPSALIKTTRMKQAAVLLVQSNVTVAEVAYSVGFSSPAYFTSNFSSYFGMTPKEFINTYTENPNSEDLKKLLE